MVCSVCGLMCVLVCCSMIDYSFVSEVLLFVYGFCVVVLVLDWFKPTQFMFDVVAFSLTLPGWVDHSEQHNPNRYCALSKKTQITLANRKNTHEYQHHQNERTYRFVWIQAGEGKWRHETVPLITNKQIQLLRETRHMMRYCMLLSVFGQVSV